MNQKMNTNLSDIQRNYSDKLQQELEAQQQVQALENLVKTKLTRKALGRYGNLKTAHPQKALQLLVVLAQAIQSQNIQQIDDNQLKELLKKLAPKRRQFKLTRK